MRSLVADGTDSPRRSCAGNLLAHGVVAEANAADDTIENGALR
jgi:hypothetical protein